MNITYLFGAGASAMSVPIVTDTANGIKEVIAKISSDEFKFADTDVYEIFQDEISKNKKSKNEARNLLINDLEWLLENSKQHASIDTFAKKLYLQTGPTGFIYNYELKKLKNAYVAYLTIIQLLHPVDKRYKIFLATILNRDDGNITFPEKVKILSWNYDFQFEKAYSNFFDHENIYEATEKLKIAAKFIRENPPKAFLLKLNGISGIIENNRRIGFNYYVENLNKDFSTNFDRILENFYNLFYYNELYKLSCKDPSEDFSALSFAWEDDLWTRSKDIPHIGQIPFMERVLSATSDTDILVIIGYSVPYFNREIDRKIIRPMRNLKKVYIQDYHPDVVKERLSSVIDTDKIDCKGITDVGQFYIPNEL
jgi:hypothetical protein